jgi:hypothetical protein
MLWGLKKQAVKRATAANYEGGRLNNRKEGWQALSENNQLLQGQACSPNPCSKIRGLPPTFRPPPCRASQRRRARFLRPCPVRAPAPWKLVVPWLRPSSRLATVFSNGCQAQISPGSHLLCCWTTSPENKRLSAGVIAGGLTLAGFMARLTGLVGPIPSARAGAGKPLEQNDYTCNLHRCIFLESNKPACWVHGCLTLECGCVFSMSESGRTLTRATPGDQTLIVGTSYNGCDSSKHFPSTASAAILISHSLVPRMVIIFHRQHQFPDLRYLAQRVPLRLSFPRDA